MSKVRVTIFLSIIFLFSGINDSYAGKWKEIFIRGVKAAGIIMTWESVKGEYANASEESKANEYFEQGVKYYNNRNYSKASDNFSQVLILSNKNAVAYYNRGLCYKNLGYITQAKSDFSLGCQLNLKISCDALK